MGVLDRLLDVKRVVGDLVYPRMNIAFNVEWERNSPTLLLSLKL